VACGPAWEAANFLNLHPLAARARFELLDFNEETLLHTTGKMADVRRGRPEIPPVKFVKNSVHNLLREHGRRAPLTPRFDLIYCSGLYDYLSDNVCRSLNAYLYALLRPGGLLVVGNFAPFTPIRGFQEHFVEWFLIYRDGAQLAALAPDEAPPENCQVVGEDTGTNLFLEVRKPE
jgi:extracellular factor (EF) 3-hydroxypalmitic acid methyl ester biosynthesis protein